MKMHQVFKKVNRAAGQVGQAVENGYFRAENPEKLDQLIALARGLAEAYQAPAPEVIHRPDRVPPGAFACYNPGQQKIFLQNFSIVSFLHEFRHHLQHAGNVKIVKDKEHDAQAWACSVYFKAKPQMFKKAVAAGRIMGVSAADL